MQRKHMVHEVEGILLGAACGLNHRMAGGGYRNQASGTSSTTANFH